MGQPVALADVRAVRDSVERPLVHAEGLAQRLHVGDDVVGPEERALCAQLAGAGAYRAGARRREIRASHLALQRPAIERTGSGSALVEDDDAIPGPLGRERAREEAVEYRQPGLAGSPREHEEHAV